MNQRLWLSYPDLSRYMTILQKRGLTGSNVVVHCDIFGRQRAIISGKRLLDVAKLKWSLEQNCSIIGIPPVKERRSPDGRGWIDFNDPNFVHISRVWSKIDDSRSEGKVLVDYVKDRSNTRLHLLAKDRI